MNNLRFRSGQVHLRKVRVAAITVIKAGDLIWLDGNVAKPAADFDWNTNFTTTQADFAALFLGIAHQPSAAGDTAPISVDVSPESVYEFDVSPSTFELGQTLGPDELSGSLMSQTLEATTVTTTAIARAAEYTTGNVSALRVSFASAFTTASTNVNATLG